MTVNKYKPAPRECALLFLKLVETREQEEKEKLNRLRLSDITLKRLWNRERLTERFLAKVMEWLLAAGWAFVSAGSTFGAVKIATVNNWPRVSWTRLKDEIDNVVAGNFDFDDLDHLLETQSDERKKKTENDTDE